MTTASSTRNSTLDLWFLNTAFAGVGDASGLQPSAVAGNLYVSLHTASPGIAGNQTTSETPYTGYARVAVARSGSGWSRTLSVVTNVSAITFGTCSAGASSTITDFGIGTASSGAGVLMFFSSVTNQQVVGIGGTPSFAPAALSVTWAT